MAAFTKRAILMLFAFFLLLLCKNTSSESYLFENDLGIAFEFKIYVDAAKEECFYQYVHPGSTLYIAFQVMRGGDGMAGFAVRHPNGQHVLPYQWQPNAQYEEQAANPGGYYELCIDNSLSRFASKLISLYVNSFKRDEWESYVKEVESLDVTVTNFTGTLKKVDERVGQILIYQDQSRKQVQKDWYLVDSNNKYVQYWSLTQCIVCIVSSCLQVYFVRKLFEYKTVTPTAKPRA